MLAYHSESVLFDMGFKSLGKNVKISDKASIYNLGEIELGDHSRIDDYCVVSGKISIGKFCHITPMCLLAGGHPGIIMSDFSTLAYGVKVFSQSDDYSGESLTNSLIPTEFKNEIFGNITIGRHVIVGAGSAIYPGVYIAEGCAIGAMSFVNRSTEPWGVYAGSPAKRLKERSRRLLELESRFLNQISNDSI
ncbi:MAG: acyltransferase [Pseudomonadales bacterium]